jgi:predicted DNA-binding transcriptional regulator AlpA
MATARLVSDPSHTPYKRTVPVAATLLALGLISEKEFAAGFGITLRTARRWELERTGPARTKVGKAVFYSREAIAAWLKSKTAKPVRRSAR